MEKFPLTGILKLLEKEDNCVFLESARCDGENFLSYVFLRPEKVVSTFKIEEIRDCFAQLDKALKQGLYVAGFLSYEAGSAFEQRLKHKQTYRFPLLWFGVYEQPLIYNHRKEDFEKCSPKAEALIKKINLAKNYKQKNYLSRKLPSAITQSNFRSDIRYIPSYTIKNIRPNISQRSYEKAIAKIKDLIAQGFTYQVNYTFKLKFAFSGSPQALYLNLRNNQSISYSAYIKTGRLYILSFSPELFFRKKGRKICARPMKGTASRGKDLKEDSRICEQLKNCLKNRSENVMIVDLLRNDLGKISTTGSVRVPHLFNVERYETLFQMTSDIESQLIRRDSAFDIFSHIFPSGSVTGAPKIKTMEIIRKLEKEPRNVYTGSIGFFSPDESGTFNVAIRTVIIDSQAQTGEMSVGSGIVYDSEAKNEFAECRLKANFLIKKPQHFEMIETMLWQPNKGYLLLDEHLKRLENSARYFDFLYNKKDILAVLTELERCFKRNSYRVRLLLDKKGKIKLESSLLKSITAKEPKIYLSTKRTQSLDPFLYHKTTCRRLYDQEFKRCKRIGFYDVIFANEKGEITEGAISNIFIQKFGKFYTPPIACGLLDGIYRKYMFSSRKDLVKEKTLFREDLLGAEGIYLSNSVRGLVKVHLETKNY